MTFSRTGVFRRSAVSIRRFFMPVLALAFLDGCSSPSPQYLNVTPQTVSVEGWEIDVYMRGLNVQAIRTSTAWGASKQDMNIRGSIAAQEVTGCRVDRRTIVGDAAVMNARLIC